MVMRVGDKGGSAAPPSGHPPNKVLFTVCNCCAHIICRMCYLLDTLVVYAIVCCLMRFVRLKTVGDVYILVLISAIFLQITRMIFKRCNMSFYLCNRIILLVNFSWRSENISLWHMFAGTFLVSSWLDYMPNVAHSLQPTAHLLPLLWGKD